MNPFLKSVFKYIISFLIVFLVGRLIFVLYNQADFSYTQDYSDLLRTFIWGIRMDLSMLSYLAVLLLPILFLYFQFQKSIFLKLFFTLWTFFVFIYFSIVIGELPIYDEWHTKLNIKAISYLKNINEVWRTASVQDVLFTFISVPLLSLLSYFGLRYLFKNIHYKAVKWYYNVAILLISLSFGFVGARGGFNEIPLSTSSVFHSKNRTLNMATMNSAWQLAYAYYKSNKYDDKARFKFYSQEQVEQQLKPLFKASGKRMSILNTPRPNIILVLLESWSADLVDSLNRKYQLMPNWQEMKKESYTFDHCYASGAHSEEGILSVYAGFPSLANAYMMAFTEKNAKLPSIPKKLDQENYYQSFFFGGDLGYANIKSFFFQNPFDKVLDEKTFPKHKDKGRLGYHDNVLFELLEQEANAAPQPFFVGGFTCTTHSPFDMPMTIKQYTSVDNAYLNSAHYADSCIGVFYRNIKQQEWFKNTLLVFVSDHSHGTPLRRKYGSPEGHRIVLSFGGGALKDSLRGQINNRVLSQIDIPKIILNQMNINTDSFIYSRDVFDSLYQDFAYFSEKTCQAAITSEGSLFYYFGHKDYEINTLGEKADSIQAISRSMLQKSYQQFHEL